MKRIFSILATIAICLTCHAETITIIPEYHVGDTLKYRIKTNVRVDHGLDSLVYSLEFFPRMVIESRNDMGFVISTSTTVGDFNAECSDPEANCSPDFLSMREIVVSEFTDSVGFLEIQLDSVCRPMSILNIDEVKERYVQGFLKMAAKQADITLEELMAQEERINELRHYLTSVIDSIYSPRHILDEQFGYTAYFSFIGEPLNFSKIIASKVLAPKIMFLTPGIHSLDIHVSGNSGNCTVETQGATDKSSVSGRWTFHSGIPVTGILHIKTAEWSDGADTFTITYTIDKIQ